MSLLICCTALANGDGEPKELPILQAWSGDCPVSQLNRLPEGQGMSRVGYIGNVVVFAGVWKALRPDEMVPEVDFSTHLIVFPSNVAFYNRTSIAKVILTDGVAEVIAIETMSALPIEDKAAMALAVIPREGVKFIQADNERIPVRITESSTDPLNAMYTTEGLEVCLTDGRSEAEATPGLQRRS